MVVSLSGGGSHLQHLVLPPRCIVELTCFGMGGMPKRVHAALRLDCFLVDVCVTSSSCSSSTFNSARHSGGVQRQLVRRSLAIASRVLQDFFPPT